MNATLQAWTRADVVTEALSWCGTRYAHQGSRKGIGADCIGLIGGVAVALDMPSGKAWARDPALKGYGRQPDPTMLIAACCKYLVPVPIADALAGDILLFRFEREPHHFGIVTQREPMRVVHAYAAARKVCETPIGGFWRQDVRWFDLILSAWRYREVAD